MLTLQIYFPGAPSPSVEIPLPPETIKFFRESPFPLSLKIGVTDKDCPQTEHFEEVDLRYSVIRGGEIELMFEEYGRSLEPHELAQAGMLALKAISLNSPSSVKISKKGKK